MTTRPAPPCHIVTTTDAAAAVLRRLARDGWRTREGFAVPDPVGRHVLYGRVTDLDQAHQAVHAATRGAGIVAVTDPDSDAGRTLLTGLRQLGPVGDPAPDDPLDRLIPEQRALLERLAAGDTIAAAAAAEYLSLRTANRRIAEARAVLGVRTTRDAVLVYLRQRRGD